MTDLTISIPKELEPWANEMRFFVELQVRKLHLNRHKGFAENMTAASLAHELDIEVAEMKRALNEESQFDAALECVDVANFAFLLALRVLSLSKDKYHEDTRQVTGATA